MPNEAWLRGPVEGVPDVLVPAAHILIQAAEELESAVQGLSAEELWATPGGAASIGFHLRHLAGSTERLLSSARGVPLTDEQRAALAAEKTADPTLDADTLMRTARTAIDSTVAALRDTSESTLYDARAVGRLKLPSNVIGLLYHIAAHATRHTGAVIATAKVVKG